MLMMGVNIHSQQQLRKEYGVGEGISSDILPQHLKYYKHLLSKQIIKDIYT